MKRTKRRIIIFYNYYDLCFLFLFAMMNKSYYHFEIWNAITDFELSLQYSLPIKTIAGVLILQYAFQVRFDSILSSV